MFSWTHARGWKMTAVPSRPSRASTVRNPCSAGVAVLVRNDLGLRAPDHHDHVGFPRRCQHVMIDMPGWPPLHVINACLKDGIGVTGANSEILSRVGLLFAQIHAPFIAGADWNMSATELESSGFPRLANITMTVPKQ
eukprot:2472761-Pyramimonas_sp.AAC.1